MIEPASFRKRNKPETLKKTFRKFYRNRGFASRGRGSGIGRTIRTMNGIHFVTDEKGRKVAVQLI